MKTFNKLSINEKIIHSKKSQLSFNFELLTTIFKFVFTKLNDPEVLDSLNTLLESFLDDIDNIISKHLSTYETDNKDNTCSSFD